MIARRKRISDRIPLLFLRQALRCRSVVLTFFATNFVLKKCEQFFSKFVTPDDLPEEVLFAEDIAVLEETLVVELVSAARALQTLGMPILIQDLENKPIQDKQTTAGALWYTI